MPSYKGVRITIKATGDGERVLSELLDNLNQIRVAPLRDGRWLPVTSRMTGEWFARMILKEQTLGGRCLLVDRPGR